MTKSELLQLIQTHRAEWETLLARLDESRLTQPGVAGEWSLKDVIAHIARFEREMVGVARAKALVGSELWDVPQDQRNAAVFKQNRRRLLAEVLAEARTSFTEMVAAIETLSDDDLNDATHFAQMPVEWRPWKIIAENSYEHYAVHAATLRAWLEKNGN